ASLGARCASRGRGHGVFGDASATLTLGHRTMLFVAGGRYPTDPVSGSVAGRYVSGGIRLRLASPARLAARTALPSAARQRTPDDDDPVPGARLEVASQPNGAVRPARPTPGRVAGGGLPGGFTHGERPPRRPPAHALWEPVR